MEAQQFHLKWNNHSLNTLSSFQHLLDTNCLVDVSLTCSSGKIVPAHRMVLAACSDYFYRLFKDLPEKHPVIVFKDASEQILNDLLEFMYRGEVEVDESNLSDFLKFADTLQVKGLSQGEGNPGWKPPSSEAGSTPTSTAATTKPPPPYTSSQPTTPRDTPPISVKDISKLGPLPEPVASMNKAYHFSSALAAGLPPHHKFPNFFPGLPVPNGTGDPADIYSHLASPTLFNALKRKYPVALDQKTPAGFDPESPVMKMPFLKEYFGKHPGGLPVDLSYPNLKEEDDEDIAERSPPPANSECRQMALNDDNDQMEMDKNGQGQGAAGRKPQGRGSRLERMIGRSYQRKNSMFDNFFLVLTADVLISAAEYKILSEYSDSQNNGQAPDMLPAITPELMKSRRTHSLQLAIGEILHNRASVQSAATKYHIPRETLRRHYQRYLKAMGIAKQETLPSGRSQTSTPTKTSPIETLAAAAAASGSGNEETPSNYSSLLDIGQAYGIWNPGEDNSNDARDLKIVEDDEEEELEDNATPESPKMLTQVRNLTLLLSSQHSLCSLLSRLF